MALPFDAHLRALVVGSAEVGEIVMRAFILRRVGLIDDGGAGAVLVGVPGTADLSRLQDFLRRNGYPHTVLDAANEAEGRAMVERLGILPRTAILCPNGTVLKQPTNAG
jgi:thioredoxin reductase (NADPH)